MNTRLTIISTENINGRGFSLCLCSCGNTKKIRTDSVKNGHARSCGCLAKDMVPKSKTHGLSESRAYNIWKQIKQRCGNEKNTHWKHYGGRGIKVCDRWSLFENFLEDMGEPNEGLSIDRIDNNGNYEKTNCRWATPKQQLNNTSRNRMLTSGGVTRTLSEWADILGCRRSVIGHRIGKLGWDIDRAVTTYAENAGEKRKERVRKCEICESEFIPRETQLRLGNGRFCSRKCSGLSMTKDKQKSC